MKKFALILSAMSLLLAGCSSGGGASEAPVENADQVSFTMAGTPVAIDCAVDTWECSNEYGGSIMEPNTYASIMVQEIFGDMDNQMEGMMDLYSAEAVEAYDLGSGQVGVLKGGETGDRIYWLYFEQLEGKDDYMVMCQGTVTEADYESVKADFETFCQSMHVE